MDKKKYPKADLTVDIVILSEFPKEGMKVLLIRRRHEPFKDHRAIPGGYLNVSERWGVGETIEEAAYRELQEETSLSKKDLKGLVLKQFKVYSHPERDPRGRVISVVFYAKVPFSKKLLKLVKAKDDAKEAKWFPLKGIPDLMAFDHKQILNDISVLLTVSGNYLPLSVSEAYISRENEDLPSNLKKI